MSGLRLRGCIRDDHTLSLEPCARDTSRATDRLLRLSATLAFLWALLIVVLAAAGSFALLKLLAAFLK